MQQRLSHLSSPHASPKLGGANNSELLDVSVQLSPPSSKHPHNNTNTLTAEEGGKENHAPNGNAPFVPAINVLNESTSSLGGGSVYHTPNTFPSSVLHSTLTSPIVATTGMPQANGSTNRPIPVAINVGSFSSPPPSSQQRSGGQALTPANLLQSITKQQISHSQQQQQQQTLQRSFGSPMAPPSFANSYGNGGLLSPSRSPQQLYRYSPIATQLGSALSPPPAHAALDFLKSTHVPSFVGMSSAVHTIRETSRPSSPSASHGGAAAPSSVTSRRAANANGPLPPPVFPRSSSRPNSSMSASSILSRERSNGPSPAELNAPLSIAEWLKATPVPTPLKRNQDEVLLSPEALSIGSSNNNNGASSATPALATTTIAAISTAALLSPTSGGPSSTPSSSASGSDIQPPLMSASVNSSTPLRTPIPSPPSNSTPIRPSLPIVAASAPTNDDPEQEHDSPAEEALFTTTTVNLFDIPPSTADSSETEAVPSSSSSSPASDSSAESSSRTHERLILEPELPPSSTYKHDSIAELLTTDDNGSDAPITASNMRSTSEINATDEEKEFGLVDPVKALMQTDAAAEICASAPPPIPSDVDSAASLNTRTTIAVAGAVVVGAAFAAYVNRKWLQEKFAAYFRK